MSRYCQPWLTHYSAPLSLRWIRWSTDSDGALTSLVHPCLRCALPVAVVRCPRYVNLWPSPPPSLRTWSAVHIIITISRDRTRQIAGHVRRHTRATMTPSTVPQPPVVALFARSSSCIRNNIIHTPCARWLAVGLQKYGDEAKTGAMPRDTMCCGGCTSRLLTRFTAFHSRSLVRPFVYIWYCLRTSYTSRVCPRSVSRCRIFRPSWDLMWLSVCSSSWIRG